MRKTRYAIILFALMALSFLAGRHFTRGNTGGSQSEHRVLYYVDPMHPAYKSDKPGIAPDCGMQLEPVYADGGGHGAEATTMPLGTVNISPEQQQLIGVRVAVAEKTPGANKIRLLGRVAADETRVYRLNAATDGFIQEAFDNSSGSMVKKDQALATFSGLDFLTAEQSYLQALTRAPESRSEVVNQADWRNQIVKLAASRLRALGMSEVELKKLATTQQPADNIQIVSPVDGFILSRSISTGQRMDKGAEFYRIADLSHVWILADVYENEAQYFRPGAVASATSPNQKRTVRATVSKVLPQFDPATRTLKLRLEADNPGFLLRPDMFVDLDLPVAVPSALTVPADALLDSGQEKRVFVDRGNGYFEPRRVETGLRLGDRVEIVAGLVAGDRVVTSGTFLLDSESRLKTVAAGHAPHDEPMSPGGNQQVKSAGTANKTPAAEEGMAKDPSCGMDVDPAKATAAGHTAEYRGVTYYFCSSGCKDNFEKNPLRYLASSHQGAAK